jgi:hypothetical protein
MRRVLTLDMLALDATILTGVGARVVKNGIATHQDAIAHNRDACGGDVYSVQHLGLNYVKSVR